MVRPLSFLAAALVGTVCAGCSASVDGKVDEESVPALFSAFFVQDKIDGIDPSNNQPATIFSVSGGGLSLFDGCNGLAKRQTAINDAFDQQTKDLRAAKNADDVNAANEDFIDAVVAYDTANLPSDYWLVSLGATAFSEDDLAKVKADIDVQNPDPKATETGDVQVCRVDNWPEKVKDDHGVPSLKTHESCFGAKKGTVTVAGWTKDKTLSITADVTLARVEPTGINPDDDAGGVLIKVSAGWCEDLENALDDFQKLEEDRASSTTGP